MPDTTTTNPSDERNSVSQMVFDMEDDLTRLSAELDVLEELTKDYKLASATENQQNVDWTIAKVVGATYELRERFNRLFEATRDRGQAKPEPVKRADPPEESLESRVRGLRPWSDLYSRWLQHQAYSEGQNAGHEAKPDDEGGDDPDGDFLTGKESALVREMIGRPATTHWQLAQKIEVLEHITMPDPSDWADKRDRLLLASIKDDVLAMGGRS